MKRFEVELSGGVHQVKCTVDVNAETKEEAIIKAKAMAKEFEDWEVNQAEICEEDISVRRVRSY